MGKGVGEIIIGLKDCRAREVIEATTKRERECSPTTNDGKTKICEGHHLLLRVCVCVLPI